MLAGERACPRVTIEEVRVEAVDDHVFTPRPGRETAPKTRRLVVPLGTRRGEGRAGRGLPGPCAGRTHQLADQVAGSFVMPATNSLRSRSMREASMA